MTIHLESVMEQMWCCLELEISQMLSQVEAHSEWRGFLLSIFLVPKNDGSHRLIINSKKLNEFIPHNHFKLVGIHMLKAHTARGFYGKNRPERRILCSANK